MSATPQTTSALQLALGSMASASPRASLDARSWRTSTLEQSSWIASQTLGPFSGHLALRGMQGNESSPSLPDPWPPDSVNALQSI